MNRKLDFLNAPKKAEQRQKLEKKKLGDKKKKAKTFGMELSFEKDHPEVPKMIETILKLYSLLQIPTDGRTNKTVSGKSSKDNESQPVKIAPRMPAVGGMSLLELGT